MNISTFEIFKIGIGPSSSHTTGPMLAGFAFSERIKNADVFTQVHSIKVDLFGSLGSTGKGHSTDIAVILGLSGFKPDTIDADQVGSIIAQINADKTLQLAKTQNIAFDSQKDIEFHLDKNLAFHPNAMTIYAMDKTNTVVDQQTYYSIGGGFILNEDEIHQDKKSTQKQVAVTYPFSTAEELLAICTEHGLCISTVMFENEKTWATEAEIHTKLLRIWQTMNTCIETGFKTEGVLPGGLHVKRRAPGLYRKICTSSEKEEGRMDWVNLYAMSVNEQNASGSQIVTAPTNGAAGIVPAVLKYYVEFCTGANEEQICRFLLVASAVGMLCKLNASVSGAEVGCQGETGSASAMAAAALTEVMGGTPQQVENAAEIAMEHSLGLTCDPIGGLVQIPCIERNAMGAVKAINASRLAMRGDGTHYISLDKVIETMAATGRDMKDIYKETSKGGLAIHGGIGVNHVEC